MQQRLKAKFKKYSKEALSNGLSGAEIAQHMLDAHGITDVRIESVSGKLTDHYNPMQKTVNLSPDVYSGRSVAAAAVADWTNIDTDGPIYSGYPDLLNYELNGIIQEFGSYAKIVSKIEKPEAVVDIDNIIDATDAIMVARGDLGVEIPYSSVPMVQKMIVEKCHTKAKPCIIATQMMESMIESQSPTRAEVNDVANSVCDGADAVMLSGETSVGKWGCSHWARLRASFFCVHGRIQPITFQWIF